MAYRLPDLAYSYDALEPHIDARTMELHHDHIHRAHVERLNRVLERSEQLENLGEHPVEKLLWSFGTVPEEARAAVRAYAGGHANHSMLWSLVGPDGGGAPEGALAEALDEEFGSFRAFKERVASVADRHFGSGWVWLVRARTRLVVYSLPNEDSPLTAEEIPLLGIDLWEHAYYRRYETRRDEYLEAFWNVVDWGEIGQRYEEGAQRSRVRSP